MSISLVVVRAFGGHAPGDVITDDGRQAAILAGEHAGHVVRVERPDAAPAALGGEG